MTMFAFSREKGFSLSFALPLKDDLTKSHSHTNRHSTITFKLAVGVTSTKNSTEIQGFFLVATFFLEGSNYLWSRFMSKPGPIVTREQLN